MRFRNSFAAFVLALVLALPTDSAFGQEANPAALGRSTAVALNYCRASFHRIKKCPSKRVLMEEQDKILNNLNLNQIADEEVIRLYTAVLDEIAQVQIVEKDKEFIRDSFKRAVFRRVTETGFQLGAQAVTGEYVGMVRTGVNSWWDYRDMVFHRDNDSWRIDKLRMEALVNKSSIFLDTFWKMARKRSMDDRWLIRNSDLDELEKAMREPDHDVRLRVLKRMEVFMECYPPYWYYVARTQQSLGQLFAAVQTYQKLIEMGSGHFRRDEMLAAGFANLSAIQDMLGQPSAVHNAEEALRRSLEVWEVNLMCARILERHGKSAEAEDAILRNLDSNLERDQSRVCLLSIYYHSGNTDKLLAALDNVEVARSIPADGLLMCSSILEQDKVPRPVVAALNESFYGYFEGGRFSSRELVLRASHTWNLEGATLTASQGEQNYGGARLAVVNGQYEVHLRRLAGPADTHASRTEAEPVIIGVKYRNSTELQLTLHPLNGSSPDTNNGAEAASMLVSVLKFRRNVYQLSGAVVGERTVVLNPAAARLTAAPVLLPEPDASPTVETAKKDPQPATTTPAVQQPAPVAATPVSQETPKADAPKTETPSEAPKASPRPSDAELTAPTTEIELQKAPEQKAF